MSARYFPEEVIVVSHLEKGVKRGKKWATPPEEIGYISKKLRVWRDNDLMDTFYPGVTSWSAAVLMSDEIIAKIAECGERVTTYEELRRHVRWRLGHNSDTNQPNEKGTLLMDKLADI